MLLKARSLDYLYNSGKIIGFEYYNKSMSFPNFTLRTYLGIQYEDGYTKFFFEDFCWWQSHKEYGTPYGLGRNKFTFDRGQGDYLMFNYYRIYYFLPWEKL